MHFDVIIIGAGMSGLAAGIRLAYFEKRVCIVEKHYAYGGLNSYYTLDGREFDVGLHAVTNYVSPDVRAAPLNKLLRQLRLTREEFDLKPQRFSEIRFPNHRLQFSNDIQRLTDEVATTFPDQIDGFKRLLEKIKNYDDVNLNHSYQPTKPILHEFLSDPILIDMLLCPLMYYGCAQEHEMDFTQFVTMFKSIFLEGFARPRSGVRSIIKTLVKKYRSCGGKLKMNCGVENINIQKDQATGVTLQTGDTLTADVILSCAGFFETMRLCNDHHQPVPKSETGRVSFVETIGVLDCLPQHHGHEAAIVFFNDSPSFTYARPDDPVDLRSGVVCCPSNYEDHDDMKEGIFRLTWLADFDQWNDLDQESYTKLKQDYLEKFVEQGNRYIPDFRNRLVYSDMFTPRTILKYTGHINGAVYGAPHKIRDGRTRIKNLYICGTDQGFLGIIGAMLSGITIANLHVLSEM